MSFSLTGAIRDVSVSIPLTDLKTNPCLTKRLVKLKISSGKETADQLFLIMAIKL